MVPMIRSRLREKLFALYFSDTDKAYYLRELARMLQVDPANLSRDLRKLVEEGLFSIERRGNQNIVTLNKSYPAIHELKQLISKTIGIRGSIVSAFRAMSSVSTVVLYGSVARGSEDATSDIDLLVIGDTTLYAIAGTLRRLEKRLGREINVTIYSSAEFSRKRRRPDAFLQSVLRKKHEILIGKL